MQKRDESKKTSPTTESTELNLEIRRVRSKLRAGPMALELDPGVPGDGCRWPCMSFR